MADVSEMFLKAKNKKDFLQGCNVLNLLQLSKEIRNSSQIQISTKSLLFLLQTLITRRKNSRNDKQSKYLRYEAISLIRRFLPEIQLNEADPKEFEIFIDFMVLCITQEHPCRKNARPGLDFKDQLQKDTVIQKCIRRIADEISSVLPTVLHNSSSRLWIMLNLLLEIKVLIIEHEYVLTALETHYTKETTLRQISRLWLHADLQLCTLENWKKLLHIIRKIQDIESMAFLLDSLLIHSMVDLDLRKTLVDESFHRYCLSLLKTVRLEKSEVKQRLYILQGATGLISVLDSSVSEREQEVGSSAFGLLINNLAWLFSVELSLELDPPVKFSISEYELSFLLTTVKPKFLHSVLEYVYIKMKFGDQSSANYSGLLSICLHIFNFVSFEKYPAKPEQVSTLTILLVKIMNFIGEVYILEVKPQTFTAAALDLTRFAKSMLLETQNTISAAAMRLLNVLISHSRSRTAFSDEGAVSLLLDSQICSLILGSSALQESSRFLVLSFLENAAKDSAVCFKMKSEYVTFFIHLIEVSVSGNTVYLDRILQRSLLFLNEHFGFDNYALDFFSIDTPDCEKPALLFKLIGMMLSCCRLQLNLESTDYIYSAETNLAAVHMIDSILRTEKGKCLIVESGKIGDLIEIGTTTNHHEIPSIIAKIVSRILTDQALTMRLSLTHGFSIAFSKLAKSSLLNIVEESIALHKSDLLVPLLSLFDYSTTNQLNTAIAILHAAPIELINSLISNHQIKNQISRSKSLEIWGCLFVAYQSGLDKYAQEAIAYAKCKISFQRISRTIKPMDPDSVLIQALLDGHRVQALSVCGEGKIEFPFPDHASLYLLKDKFMDSSIVFKAMIEDPFEESQSNRVVIEDVDYDRWFMLLSFIIFHAQVQEIAINEFQRPTTLDELEVIYDLIELADKFLIPTLHQALFNFLKDCLLYCSIAKQEALVLSIFCYLKNCGFEFSGKERLELLHLSAVCILGSF